MIVKKADFLPRSFPRTHDANDVFLALRVDHDNDAGAYRTDRNEAILLARTLLILDLKIVVAARQQLRSVPE